MVAEACSVDIVTEDAVVALSEMEAVEGEQDLGTAPMPVVVENPLKTSNNEEMGRHGLTFREKAWKFFKFYFLEGQEIDDEHKIDKDDPNANHSWVQRNRQILALAIPFVIVQIIWWTLMITQDWFYLFNEPFGDFEKPRYWIAVTMIFGSMVAGATAEGGAGKRVFHLLVYLNCFALKCILKLIKF